MCWAHEGKFGGYIGSIFTYRVYVSSLYKYTRVCVLCDNNIYIYILLFEITTVSQLTCIKT